MFSSPSRIEFAGRPTVVADDALRHFLAVHRRRRKPASSVDPCCWNCRQPTIFDGKPAKPAGRIPDCRS